MRAAALRGLGRVLLEGDLLGMEAPGFRAGVDEPDPAHVRRAREALRAAFAKGEQ